MRVSLKTDFIFARWAQDDGRTIIFAVVPRTDRIGRVRPAVPCSRRFPSRSTRRRRPSVVVTSIRRDSTISARAIGGSPEITGWSFRAFTTSQRRRVPSALAVTTSSFDRNFAPVTVSVCPARTDCWAPVIAFHTRAVLSELAVTIRFPSGLNEMSKIGFL